MNSNILPLLSSLGYGTSDFLVKVSSRHTPPFRLLFLSQFLGLPLTIFFFTLFQTNPITFLKDLPINILLAFFDFLVSFLLFRALTIGTASIVSPILSSNIVISLAVSSIFFHESISISKIIFVIICLLGLIIIGRQDSNSKTSRGVPEAILASVLLGTFLTFWGQLSLTNHWTNIILTNRIVISLLALPFMLRESKQPLRRNQIVWHLSLVNAASQIITSLSYLSSVGVFITVLLLNSAAIVTLFLSQLFLREKLNPSQWIAIILVIVGSLGSLL